MAEIPASHHTKSSLGSVAILTAEGGQYELPEEVRPHVAFLETGDLYISKSHVFDAHVASFIGRLEKLGEPFERQLVDMTVIKEIYSREDGRGNLDKTGTQRDVMDLFKRAVFMRASDIHIRVDKQKTRILFRVNNDLEFIREETAHYGVQMCTAIYQSMTEVSDATFELNARQDARISNKEHMPADLDGMRVATTPQVGGNVMVLRLLYNDSVNDFSLASIGFDKKQEAVITLLRRLPTGINLISGPTGSGKSTTLQRILGAVNQEHEGRKHIITIEDPPEYHILGAIQTYIANVETEEQRSAAFQKAIKASLRLDPDIIMIGEMRDAPSSRLAIEAAMTGHQVWSTVHANSALAILDRLIDMGVDSSLVYDHSIVSGLACQRLLKTLCPHCKVKITDNVDRYNSKDFDRVLSCVSNIDTVYVQGSGCKKCNNSGTSGRTAVVETIKTDAKLMQFYRNDDKIGAETYWRHDQDGKSILDSTIVKIEQGLIDPFSAETIVGPLIMGKIERDHGITAEELMSAIS